jgi:hypothetical protein
MKLILQEVFWNTINWLISWNQLLIELTDEIVYHLIFFVELDFTRMLLGPNVLKVAFICVITVTNTTVSMLRRWHDHLDCDMLRSIIVKGKVDLELVDVTSPSFFKLL